MDVHEQLRQAALKVYATAGTRGATTRRIAREAGVNEVTLFRHFGSKDALLRDAVLGLYNRSVVRRLPAVPVDPAAELTEWCRSHYAFLTKLRFVLRTTLAEVAERPDQLADAIRLPLRIADELHAYLLRLRARGLARGRWNARAAAAMLMGTLYADATQRDLMPQRFPYSQRDAVRHYVTLFLAAIGASPAPRPARGRAARSERRRHAPARRI